MLFTDLIEPAPRLTQQFPSSQLLLPCRVPDRVDAGVETLAEVGQLGRERQRPFADKRQSAPIRGKSTFLSLVHESLSRKVTIEPALAAGSRGVRVLRAHRVRSAVDDVRIIIPCVGERR